MDVAIDIFPTRACQAVRRTQPRDSRSTTSWSRQRRAACWSPSALPQFR